jgi:hypothetical protein
VIVEFALLASASCGRCARAGRDDADAVAERSGFAAGELAGEAQRLGPGELSRPRWAGLIGSGVLDQSMNTTNMRNRMPPISFTRPRVVVCLKPYYSGPGIITRPSGLAEIGVSNGSVETIDACYVTEAAPFVWVTRLRTND